MCFDTKIFRWPESNFLRFCYIILAAELFLS